MRRAFRQSRRRFHLPEPPRATLQNLRLPLCSNRPRFGAAGRHASHPGILSGAPRLRFLGSTPRPSHAPLVDPLSRYCHLPRKWLISLLFPPLFARAPARDFLILFAILFLCCTPSSRWLFSPKKTAGKSNNLRFAPVVRLSSFSLGCPCSVFYVRKKRLHRANPNKEVAGCRHSRAHCGRATSSLPRQFHRARRMI